MKLTENFSLAELTKSQTAERKGIPNTPTKLQEQSLKLIAEKILQPVRDHYDIPFTPSSGFRSPELCIAVAQRFELTGVFFWRKSQNESDVMAILDPKE